MAWAPIFVMRCPCAPGPYHPGPIDCVSLNSFQNLRPFQQKNKMFIFCTCVRFNNKNKEVHVLYLRPFQQRWRSSRLVRASVSKQNLEVCGVSCLGHLEKVDMLSSIHWPGPQFSTCVGLARLAPYHPCPDRLRIPEQVAKLASVSMNKLVFCS